MNVQEKEFAQEGPSVLVKGLSHPLLDKVITAMIVKPGGIEVTVDSGTTYLFVGAVDMVAIGGLVGGRSRIDMLKEMIQVQGQKGNWDTDKYMWGLYNGMEFAASIMESREPKFLDWPYTRWQYLWKRMRIKFWRFFKFSKVLATQSTGGEVNANNRPIKP